MSLFWQSVKKAFKELIFNWWFICGVFTEYIVALLCGFVGIILMFTKGDAYSYINYNWAKELISRLYTYPLTSELKPLFKWFFQRGALLFLAFFLVFVCFSAVKKSHNDRNFKKVLGGMGLIYFLVNLIATLIVVFIVHSAEDVRTPPFLSTITNVIAPFSVSTFIFLCALANTNRDIFNWKMALRVVAMEYLIFVVSMAVLKIIFAVIPTDSRIPIYIIDCFSFFFLAFQFFIYAAVFSGETILKSITRGMQFFVKNFGVALLLSLVVLITKPSFLTRYMWSIIRSGRVIDFLDMDIFPLLNPFISVSVFVVAIYYYREKSSSDGAKVETVLFLS